MALILSTLILFFFIINSSNVVGELRHNKQLENKRKLTNEIISNNITISFTNVAGKVNLFVYSSFSSSKTGFYRAYLLDNENNISENITSSLSSNKVSEKNALCYNFGTTVSSPTVLIELLINPKSLAYLFYQSQASSIIFDKKFQTSETESMKYMFFNCQKLTSLNINSLNTTNVKDMSWLFQKCNSLTKINIDNFDTSNVNDISGMFDSCSSLTSINLENFNTSSVTTFRSMFYGCSSLTSLNLSNFDTKNAISMNSMFSGCNKLEYINVENFNTENVEKMYCMFYGCSSLKELNLSNFVTTNILELKEMFKECTSLKNLNIENLIIKNDTKADNMFDNVNNLENCIYYELYDNFISCSKSIEIKNCSNCDNDFQKDYYCNREINSVIYKFYYTKNKTNISIINDSNCYWYNDEENKNNNSNINCDEIFEVNISTNKENIIVNFIPLTTIFNLSSLKVIEDICYENFEEITNNIKNISLSNTQFNLSSSLIISLYSTFSNLYNISEKYPNITLVDLDECKSLILKEYNLSNETELFIIGYDKKNNSTKSAINYYNYEIYLSNGTLINNIEKICNATKIKMSSAITDLDLVKYDKAVLFHQQGYDIYNLNDKFYNDHCSSASIDNNDIILTDRKNDFYLNDVIICQNNCEYSYVNLTSKRFFCECNISSNTNNTDEEKDTDNNDTNDDNEDISYSEYLLSLFNYKVITCIELLGNTKNLIYNLGFYAGSIITLSCLIEMFIFLKCGMKKLKKNIYENIPEDQKLKKSINVRKIKRKKNFTVNYTKHIKHSPPLKKSNINNKKFDAKKTVKTKITKISSRKPSTSESFIEEKTKCSINNKLRKIKKHKSSNFKFNSNMNTEFIIDLNYQNLIIKNDSPASKDELNDIPYSQALQIDKRSYFEVALSFFKDEVDLLNIIFLRSEYSYLPLLISIYTLEINFDLSLNCFLYTDDYVSEKYHNDGRLEKTTTFFISIFSNALSSLITFYIKKLTNYYEKFELIIKQVKRKSNYLIKCHILIKMTKILLGIFFSLQIIFNIIMTIYMSIFCSVYYNTQVSMVFNYFIGIVESLALSLGYALLFSLLRYISLKYRLIQIYYTSKYLIEHI